MEPRLKDLGTIVHREGGQDQSVLEVEDRRVGDGVVYDREDLRQLEKIEEAPVVGQHQPEHADLPRAVEPLLADVGPNTRLYLVHGVLRSVAQRGRNNVFDDRATRYTNGLQCRASQFSVAALVRIIDRHHLSRDGVHESSPSALTARTTGVRVILRSEIVVELSVVIPVYGCTPCLTALTERLRQTIATLGVTYEIVFVDDRSPDGAWDVLTELAGAHREVSGNPTEPELRTTRSHHGRSGSRSRTLGDRHGLRPPGPAREHPAARRRKHSEGYDIVFARRKSRQHSVIDELARACTSGHSGVFFGSPMDGEYGTFSIISRKVIDAFLELARR